MELVSQFETFGLFRIFTNYPLLNKHPFFTGCRKVGSLPGETISESQTGKEVQVLCVV